MIDTRIEKSNRRLLLARSRGGTAALISMSSGFSSHGELYRVLRRNSETRSLVWATPVTVTT